MCGAAPACRRSASARCGIARDAAAVQRELARPQALPVQERKAGADAAAHAGAVQPGSQAGDEEGDEDGRADGGIVRVPVRHQSGQGEDADADDSADAEGGQLPETQALGQHRVLAFLLDEVDRHTPQDGLGVLCFHGRPAYPCTAGGRDGLKILASTGHAKDHRLPVPGELRRAVPRCPRPFP